MPSSDEIIDRAETLVQELEAHVKEIERMTAERREDDESHG